eukprot:NODE_588_length_5657_cov_0.948183.p1 type:complete len:610 gc:universal NODE_588_length_5657_cov_0.948183:3898-2069(-)
MANSMSWITLGIILHILFALSIFDIYFVSPIVNIPPIPLENKQSKRVVVAIADGLRHDTFYDPHFNNGSDIISPFVFSKIFKGAYGTSICKAPTESRPGHMSIFCGITEDPSAVLRGWSKNPVEVDCVLNNTNAYLFGDLGITHTYVPHLQLSLINGHLIGQDHKHYIDGFPEYDFKSDYLKMNKFVRDGVFNLFKKAETNETLKTQLYHQSLFFFHFCGVDSAGHAFRPHSKEYINTVKQVDAYLEEIEVLFNEFYGTTESAEEFQKIDHETTWIYTADHGMSDRGSHGDSDPHNIKTPFVIWGSNISPDIFDSDHELQKHFDFYESWLLDHKLQYDITAKSIPQPTSINQIDIASLIGILLGSSVPSNNLGVVPIKLLPKKKRLNALIDNYNQLKSLYLHKETQKRIGLRFWQFKPHSLSSNTTSTIFETLQSIESVKEGIQYYQTYDKSLVQLLITAGYIIYMLCTLLKYLTIGELQASDKDLDIAITLWTVTVLFICLRAETWSFSMYILLIATLLTILIPLRHNIKQLLDLKNFLEILFCGIWVAALSQSYLDSTTISYFYLVLGPMMLLFSQKKETAIFCGACLIFSIFPTLPLQSDIDQNYL